MNPLYDIFSKNILDSNKPYTHTFSGLYRERWPDGLYQCLKRQGFMGPNVIDTTYTWSEYAS